MENENKKAKALCDYLLGYWEFEIDDDELDENMFNNYFINKYGVNLDKELNIGCYSCWKGAHIELSNLLDENNELRKLLIAMVFSSSSRTSQNTERINILLEDLYKKI
jgi:hypothetical protein